MQTYISDSWDKVIGNYFSDNSDIYFSENYLKLQENEEISAKCFIHLNGDNAFILPFLKQIVKYNTRYYDIETPYGYGGPLVNTNDALFIEEAQHLFMQNLKQDGAIAAFFRFHPLFDNYKFLNNVIEVIPDRSTVAIDLNLSVDEIWTTQIHSKHRNVIRRAQKEGLEFVIDKDFTYYSEFKEIYRNTMLNLRAQDSYFFSDNYFDKLKKNLNQHSFLGLVKYKNTVISASIFFTYDKYGHYHLSGSNPDYLKLYPNNFMLFETLKYMKTQGIHCFHLGGGTDSSMENSLLKFKSRFSKQFYKFYIGKSILDPTVYSEICSIWKNNQGKEKIDSHKHILLKYKF